MILYKKLNKQMVEILEKAILLTRGLNPFI